MINDAQKKKLLTKMSPELFQYIQVFGKFKDEAAPSPEIIIRVKRNAEEFYNNHLDAANFILLFIKGNSIHVHCKPRLLLDIVDMENIEFMDIVIGLYEPM
jgi:hypothetical protein